MKVTLLHGNDNIKSRARFVGIIEKAKEKGFEIVNIESFLENLTSQSLFADKVLFVAEKPKAVNLERISQDYNLLIWLDRPASASFIKSLPKGANIEKFDLPRIIFKFLDSFCPGNARECLILLDELLKAQPVELVFSMLATHLRDMIALPPNPPWRQAKLASQAKKFGFEKVKKIISEMAEIDIKSKTSDMILKDSLDLFIVKNLE